MMPCVGSWQCNLLVPLSLLVVGCCVLWTVVCRENSLVLDLVDVIVVAALILPCVDSWQ